LGAGDIRAGCGAARTARCPQAGAVAGAVPLALGDQRPGGAAGLLSAVGAAARTDAWAVGSSGGFLDRALTLHWDGVRWSRVALPASRRAALSAVAAVSARSVWAVGGPTILHWDGVSWRAVRWRAPTRADLLSITVARARGGWTAFAAGAWGSPSRPLIIARCG